MKKLILFTIVIMMTLTAYGTTGIQVQKPGTGHIIYPGSANGYMIKWLVTGNIHQFVKIRLYDKTGNTQIYKITDKTPSKDGQYLWPKNMLNNTNYGEYVIRVRTIDNLHSDDSGIFHIKKKQGLTIINPKISKKPVINVSNLKEYIKVTSPTSGAYKVNEPLTINWDKNFGNYEFVWVYVYYTHNSNNVAIKGTNLKNTGATFWTPQSNYNGYDIYVEIKTSDNKFYGRSGKFTLSNPVAVELQ